MEEDTEYLKLPVEDRVVHKLWKARLHGYEEVTKFFRQQDDEKSPEFSKYLGLVKKFVVDSNAVAQEKGLEAVLAYVECYALAGKTVGEVIAGIVGKCIAAPKTKTRELAVAITLMYVEAEKADIVQEELIKGMEHKNPKISAACVACMTLALKEFGSKVVAIKPLVKKISSLLEDRDKGVREEGKAMVIEMYRWVGVALKPQLANLKPVQISELEAEFEKVKNDRAVPTRFLRSQQEKQAKMIDEAAGGDSADVGEADEADAPPEVDPYELIDPVDILSQLPKDFYERVEAKKWQDRKETMDLLEKLLQAPKLESGDYGDVVRALKKIISKDSNVVVVAVAGKCLACLAKGLNKRFSPFAGACIPSVLEKFKEKKVNVVTAMREAIDAIYPSTNIEAIQEDVVAALESKNPQVKVETASFLARCFTKCTPTLLNKKVLKGYVTVLLKMLIDPDPLVRDNAAEALGTAMKVVGEKAMAPFWVDLDPAKQNKIRDCSEKAVIVAKVVAVRPATAPAKVAAAPKAGSAAAKPVKRPATTAAAGAKKPAAKKPVAAAASAKAKPVMERELSSEEVDEKASEIFSKDIITGLSDPVWKTRLTAVENFMQVISGLEPAELNSQVLLRTLNKKPGLKDTNVQVMKARLDAVKLICESTKVSSVAVESCLSDIAVNMGDAKNGALTAEVLTSLAEATKLDLVAVNVLDFAFTQQKSPKVQVETMTWLADAIKEFGFCVQPKALMDNVKKAVEAPNAQVRNAGISLAGVIYLYMGQQLTQFFECEKPSLQQLLFAEFEKRASEVAPVATRGVSSSTGDLSPNASDEAIVPAEVNVHDLMPHADISEQITEELINELKDKNWKVRMEALVKVQAMVTDKLVTSNLGELPPVLSARLSDSNSKIAATAMTVCQALAMAMGSQGKIHLRSLFPSIVLGLGDSKSWIRAAAIECLNAWGLQCGFKEFFSGEMVAEALTNGSPQLRSDLWAWLELVLSNLPPRAVPKDELLAMLPSMFAHLEDRNPDVRKNCQAAVLPVMTHLDYEPILKASEKLKPGSRTVVNAVLDKVRSMLPPKPMPVKKGASGAGDAPQKTATSARPKTAAVVKKSATGVAGKVAVGRKKEEDMDSSPLLQLNSLKNQRSIDEQKLKVLKWSFTLPREEFVDLLKEQLAVANANKSLIANMFHADFKYHLRAIDSLHEYLADNYKPTVANLDLILKWMSLRFFDTNPSVLLRGLEYLNAVFIDLEKHKYNLHEYEASSFLPYLMLKIGDPKDAVRAGVKKVILLVDQVYPHSKLFAYVMDGLKSKNARQRTECLDTLALLIEKYSLTVCSPNAPTALKEIARQIADRDNSVRNAALNCIVQGWYIEGDKVYKMLGQISDKDMSLLEERIKRAEKKRPVPSAAAKPQPPVEEPPAQEEPEEEDEQEEEEEVVRREETPPAEPAPRTAVVKPRSVSGPFGLDRDLLERIEGNGIALRAPQLAEFDLNGILDDNFMDVPVSKNSRAPLQMLSPPKPLLSPLTLPQPRPLPTNLLYACPQPDKDIDHAVSAIASTDLNTAIVAMNQVDALLQSDSAHVLTHKVDQVVLASVMQMRKVGETHRDSLELRAKAYRTLLLMLVSLYKNAGLSERVSRGSLKDLVDQLLKLLDGQQLSLLENEASFSRVINILVVKIIEKSDHTNLTCALIKLLHSCVDCNGTPRYLELVMKCLWKVVKLLPGWTASFEYNIVLLDIHLFLRDHPTSVWKKRSSDIPLRTVKTIVHTMVKMRGPAISTELDLIENTKESELEYYLCKLIKAVKQEDAPAPKEVRRLSRSTHEHLAEMFKKIGSRDQTQEGLSALYDFKQAHPEADIEPFLRKSSDFFQKYIEEGLQTIERSRRTSATYTQHTEHNAPSASPTATEDVGLKDAAYFTARLRAMQQQAGIQETDNNAVMLQQPSSPDSINALNDNINRNNQLNDDKQELSSILRTSSTTTMSNLDQLRQRLDRVKGTSNRDKIS